VMHDEIGTGYLFQRASLVPRLTAALARFAAHAAQDPRWLLQSVARGRLAAVRTVLVELTAKIPDLAQCCILLPQDRDLAPKRFNQLANLSRENHP